MSFFRHLAGAYIARRVLRGARSRRPSRGGYRGSAYARAPYGYGRRRRSSRGFLGPFPYYSRRTRGGSRVTVSGCCLPIPLGIVGAFVLGAWRLAHR